MLRSGCVECGDDAHLKAKIPQSPQAPWGFPLTSKSPTEVVEAMVAHFNAHELDAVYALITEDYRQSFNGVFVSEGRAAARAADAGLYENFPDYRRTTVSLIADRDEVALEWRLLGTSVTGAAIDCALISRASATAPLRPL
jgi:hypothetical protein